MPLRESRFKLRRNTAAVASLSYCRIILSAQCTRQSSNFLAMTLAFVQNSASVAD